MQLGKIKRLFTYCSNESKKDETLLIIEAYLILTFKVLLGLKSKTFVLNVG